MNDCFYGNAYIMIPAFITSKNICFKRFEKVRDEEIGHLLNIEISKRMEQEISKDLYRSLSRYHLGSYLLSCFDEIEQCSEGLQYKECELLITIDKKTSLSVVTIVLYDKKFMASQLLDRISSDNISINKGVSLKNYMKEEFGVNLLSKFAKTCLSTCEKIDNEVRISYLAGETYNSENMNAKLTSRELETLNNDNIAQYNSSEIYAGKNCVLRVDKRSKNEKNPSPYSDSVFIFIMEILVFKQAASSRTNVKTLEAISNSVLLETNTLERITNEFSNTLPFWDIQIFNYTTAQNLANKLNHRFGIDDSYSIYKQNQDLLKHKINIKQAIQQEIEDKILFSIALILFSFEVSPYLFNLYLRIINKDWFSNSEAISIIGSGFSTIIFSLIIVKIIKRKKK